MLSCNCCLHILVYNIYCQPLSSNDILRAADNLGSFFLWEFKEAFLGGWGVGGGLSSRSVSYLSITLTFKSSIVCFSLAIFNQLKNLFCMESTFTLSVDSKNLLIAQGPWWNRHFHIYSKPICY